MRIVQCPVPPNADQLSAHRYAEAYNPLSDAEFEQLVDDIKDMGLLDPVVMFEGAILDGRHRHKACPLAGVEPRFEEFIGTQREALKYVKSKNSHRRHMNRWQQACALVRLEKLDALIKKGEKKLAKSQGALPGVPEVTVEQVERIERDAIPELKAALERGDVRPSLAAEIADNEPEVQAAAVAAIEKAAAGKAEPVRAVSKPAMMTPSIPYTERTVADGKVAVRLLSKSPIPEARSFVKFIELALPGVCDG